MTRQEAGHIKAKLTRAGWYITSERYDGQYDDPESQIIAIVAVPNVYSDDFTEFSHLDQCPKQTNRRPHG